MRSLTLTCRDYSAVCELTRCPTRPFPSWNLPAELSVKTPTARAAPPRWPGRSGGSRVRRASGFGDQRTPGDQRTCGEFSHRSLVSICQYIYIYIVAILLRTATSTRTILLEAVTVVNVLSTYLEMTTPVDEYFWEIKSSSSGK